MSKFSLLTTLALALLLAGASGCTRRSHHGCFGLPLDECRAAGCDLEPGCCGGPSQCVPPGGGSLVLCGPCFQCEGLSETDCKANPQCRANYCTDCGCGSGFAGCIPIGAIPVACPAIDCVRECSCNGLDEQSCIASAASLGCTPVYCPDCRGGQQFSECLGPTQGAPACPAVCPSDCRGDSDCGSGMQCQAPGEVSCGGACRADPSCVDDGECGTGQVCDFAPCQCSPGRVCVPGCTSADQCREGESCSNHHCVPRTCASPTQCPRQFECVVVPGPGGGAQCQRSACRTDAECNGGYCVDGACYATLGMCTAPPP